jgi:hypothetical protein
MRTLSTRIRWNLIVCIPFGSADLAEPGTVCERPDTEGPAVVEMAPWLQCIVNHVPSTQ